MNGKAVSHDQWADEVIFDYAIDFIKTRDARPQLLYLPSLSPHTPLRAPERWIRFHRDQGVPENLAVLQAMVSNLDEQVGRLIETLKQEGQWENTP